MYKISLVILSFLLISNVNATAKSLSFERLYRDPVTFANVVVVGKLIEDSSGRQFIIPERGWTAYPERINIPPKFDIDRQNENKKGIVGKKYLLYMTKEARYEEVQSKDQYKFIGHLVIELLQDAKATIEKFSEKKDFVGEINPSWQFCESDKECVQAKNQCGKLIAVNKKYQKDYLNFLKTNKIKVDCSKEIQTQASCNKESKCIDFFC